MKQYEMISLNSDYMTSEEFNLICPNLGCVANQKIEDNELQSTDKNTNNSLYSRMLPTKM